jgi:Fe2+ or Zn2+ uptake regulation protein
MKGKDLRLLAWVLRGSQRREIIKVIDGRMIPAQIYKEAIKLNPKITRNSISDVLRAFRKAGVVRCINPEEKKGRIYELTAQGKMIKKEFKIN